MAEARGVVRGPVQMRNRTATSVFLLQILAAVVEEIHGRMLLTIMVFTTEREREGDTREEEGGEVRGGENNTNMEEEEDNGDEGAIEMDTKEKAEADITRETMMTLITGVQEILERVQVAVVGGGVVRITIVLVIAVPVV